MSRDASYLTHLEDRIENNLRKAIGQMQDALDELGRMDNMRSLAAIESVQSKLAWGLANASSSIGGAISAAADVQATRDQIAKEAYEALERRSDQR